MKQGSVRDSASCFLFLTLNKNVWSKEKLSYFSLDIENLYSLNNNFLLILPLVSFLVSGPQLKS